jgi:hypothetical protein
MHRPRQGPSVRQVAQVKALAIFQRAMRLFPAPCQQRMIQTVLLSNVTIGQWCIREGERQGCSLNPKHEMGRLLGILDNLSAHFRTDVEQAVDSGRMLPVEA